MKEEIGGKKDDDEKNIINESDHDTDSEIEINQEDEHMWTLKALKIMIMMTNILWKFDQPYGSSINHKKPSC